MKTLVAVVIAFGVALVATPTAQACLWDYDTFKEEGLGKAELTQVLKGELRKHSKAFYEAKVTYTRAIVDAGNAKKERYDDLAVALAKTGKLDDAIAVLTDKEKKFPGEYTTEANLGTFLAMKGDFTGALEHIKKGLEINPDAHFGREIVQVKLLEYLARMASDKDLAAKENFLGLSMKAEDVLVEGVYRTKKTRDKDLDKTIVGLVGLIRFGDAQDIPDVWFALGWALATQGDGQLAVRAMRRADKLGHPRAAADGSLIASTLHKMKPEVPCCGDPSEERYKTLWAKVSTKIDPEWTKGEALDKKRQAKEDKKITKKQWKAAFGY
jgi:tetratricopeptide (TPR) repeat protein